MSSCHWCGGDCGATCLGITNTQMSTDDPAYFMLSTGPTSTTSTDFDDRCYICRDPEFAQMGLPLCYSCPVCQRAGRGNGHIPADDETCTVCGTNGRWEWELEEAVRGGHPAAIYEASGGRFGSPESVVPTVKDVPHDR